MASFDEKNELEWPVNRVRSTFFKYFVEQRGHTYWASSPVVPVNDPTLLFANAGMNQFKPLFLGTCDPTLEMSKLKAAVNSQKCIRAGGKHNDLDDVGKDVYHHTFFEMLGNWSFGFYFKEEAITWAWECLTVVFGIDPTRLYATYFGGDESQGLVPDLEAREIWLRFLPSERVLPCGCKENFWEMGATGPCGPCTEIHYDRIGNRDAASLVNADVPDVIEIWNNVFIQFNREADGSLRELPSKHVDTGMGLERLTSVLQNKSSNYDTDIFMPIFAAIQAATGAEAYGGLVGKDDVTLRDTAYRVVADHIRTLSFAITDGAVPSNDGRGYVLKRILRRAIRYGQEILGGPEGFFQSLVPVVVKNFSEAFPELLQRQDFVRTIIAEEEKSFSRTLAMGVRYFNKLVVSLKNANETIVPAKEAHNLFSSMGFPLDLTELMAAEHGLTVDKAGFNDLMDNDRKISEAAENARKGGGGKDMTMEAEQTAWLQNLLIPATDSSSKYTWNVELPAQIVGLFFGRGGEGSGFVDEVLPSHGLVGVILDSTSFYYESGGQVFDMGRLITSKGDEFIVANVQTYAGYVVHVGFLVKGSFTMKQDVTCMVDYERRSLIAPNHTMTHALNYALRNTLIPADDPNPEKYFGLCEQKGSLVDPERLRFDFSWTSPLSNEHVAAVESQVSELIKRQETVYAEVVPLAEAKNINGLRQVFGEKYPDPVRVISIGVSVDALLSDTKASHDISIEFCGGTHLQNTKEAEDFVIVEESGISKGVRRIVGITRGEALAARDRADKISSKISRIESLPCGPELSEAMKVARLEVDQAYISLVSKELFRQRLSMKQEELRGWQKANLAKTIAAANDVATELANSANSRNERVIVANIEFGGDGKVAKKIQDLIRGICTDSSLFLISIDQENDKTSMFVQTSSTHIATGLQANDWMKSVLDAIGTGKGGGKPDQCNGFVTGCDAHVIERMISIAKQHAHSKVGV